jgi:hypothetical protein
VFTVAWCCPISDVPRGVTTVTNIPKGTEIEDYISGGPMPPLGHRREDNITGDIDNDGHLCFNLEHDLDLFGHNVCKEEVSNACEEDISNVCEDEIHDAPNIMKWFSPVEYLKLLFLVGFALMCSSVQ